MPFVEITSGTGALTPEQKIKLNKAVTNSVKDFYQEEKGTRMFVEKKYSRTFSVLTTRGI